MPTFRNLPSKNKLTERAIGFKVQSIKSEIRKINNHE